MDTSLVPEFSFCRYLDKGEGAECSTVAEN